MRNEDWDDEDALKEKKLLQEPAQRDTLPEGQFRYSAKNGVLSRSSSDTSPYSPRRARPPAPAKNQPPRGSLPRVNPGTFSIYDVPPKLPSKQQKKRQQVPLLQEPQNNRTGTARTPAAKQTGAKPPVHKKQEPKRSSGSEQPAGRYLATIPEKSLFPASRSQDGKNQKRRTYAYISKKNRLPAKNRPIKPETAAAGKKRAASKTNGQKQTVLRRSGSSHRPANRLENRPPKGRLIAYISICTVFALVTLFLLSVFCLLEQGIAGYSVYVATDDTMSGNGPDSVKKGDAVIVQMCELWEVEAREIIVYRPSPGKDYLIRRVVTIHKRYRERTGYFFQTMADASGVYDNVTVDQVFLGRKTAIISNAGSVVQMLRANIVPILTALVIIALMLALAGYRYVFKK